MEKPNDHTISIDRAIFDLTCEVLVNPQQLQNSQSKWMRTQVIPLFRKVCEKVIPGDRHIRIDKLEIELGEIDIANFEQEFLRKFAEASRKALRKTMEVSSGPAPKPQYHNPAQPNLDEKGSEARNRNVEILLSYFQTGAFPWWASSTESKSTAPGMLYKLAEEQPEEGLKLFRKISASDQGRKRLLFAMMPTGLKKIAQILNLPNQTLIRNRIDFWVQELTQTTKKTILDSQKTHWVWDAWFIMVSNSSKIIIEESVDKIIHSSLKALSISERAVFEAFFLYTIESQSGGTIVPPDFVFESQKQKTTSKQTDSKSSESNTEDSSRLETQNPTEALDGDFQKITAPQTQVIPKTIPIQSSDFQDVKAELKTKKPEQENSLLPQGVGAKKLPEQIQNILKKNPAKSQDLPKGNVQQKFDRFYDMLASGKLPMGNSQISKSPPFFSPIEKEEISRYNIPNAGLALIWPFSANYFQRLGLLKRGAFIDPAASRRAVLLLNYLITNEVKALEKELIFNKLLCGLACDAPIELQFKPDSREINESGLLLEAVYNNWPPLKGSSIPDLQKTFLQRKGLLIRQKELWQLKVQTGPFDVLLEKIPWSYKLIFQKWIKQPIHVEWFTT